MTRPLKIYLADRRSFFPTPWRSGSVRRISASVMASRGFIHWTMKSRGMRQACGPTFSSIVHVCAHMRAADLGIFNLTPFRGPSADVGTVFELGFFAGLGKPAFGYTNDVPRIFLNRVKTFDTLSHDAEKGEWRDGLELSVENFGNADNLMIDAALAEQGRAIVRHAADASARYHDLTGFETCLRQAAELFAVDAKERSA